MYTLNTANNTPTKWSQTKLRKFTHHIFTLKTAKSILPIRSHSTKLFTAYGHTQQSENYTYPRVSLNTANSTHTVRSQSTQRKVKITYRNTYHSENYTYHTVTPNTVNSTYNIVKLVTTKTTHTIRPYSTQKKVHIPHGHNQQSEKCINHMFSLNKANNIQGVPGGMCQTLGGCSLC